VRGTQTRLSGTAIANVTPSSIGPSTSLLSPKAPRSLLRGKKLEEASRKLTQHEHARQLKSNPLRTVGDKSRQSRVANKSPGRKKFSKKLTADAARMVTLGFPLAQLFQELNLVLNQSDQELQRRKTSPERA
jgi:hypothetical protein